MKTEDIERYKRELLAVGKRINDFGADYAHCALDKKRKLPDITKLTEDIFEIPFLAGRRDVLDLLRKTNVRAWEELLVYIGGG